jgi:arylformamidase
MRFDVPYGRHPAERLDVFLASRGAAAAPVHVFVHGGYWHRLDKADFSFVAELERPDAPLSRAIRRQMGPA